MRGITCAIIAFISFAGCFGAYAQEPEKGFVQPLRLCKESDLKGTYKMVQLQENPPSFETPWFHDYPSQFISFLPGHTYNFVATKRSVSNAVELQKAMSVQEEEGFHQVKKYTLDDKGELDLYLGDRVDYNYRCIISATDTPTTHKNDMTLLGYSKGNSSLNKLFRPWP